MVNSSWIIDVIFFIFRLILSDSRVAILHKSDSQSQYTPRNLKRLIVKNPLQNVMSDVYYLMFENK